VSPALLRASGPQPHGRWGTAWFEAAVTLGAVVEVPDERFEELVAEALDGIPAELAARMDNVVVVVDEGVARPHLLGLYEGIPLTERRDYGVGMVVPDRITIFRRPILRMCRTEDDVVRQVRITVIHEVGHHFGIDDDRLHELGWG
jgi:predicted Zn-dependent protease with MMP-like domain